MLGENLDLRLEDSEKNTAQRELLERPYLRQLRDKFRGVGLSDDVFYFIHMRTVLTPEERGYVSDELEGEFQRFEKGLTQLGLIGEVSKRTDPWYVRSNLPTEFKRFDPLTRTLMYNESQLYWLNTFLRNAIEGEKSKRGSDLTEEEIERLKEKYRYAEGGDVQKLRDKWRVFSDWCVDIAGKFPHYDLANSA